MSSLTPEMIPLPKLRPTDPLGAVRAELGLMLSEGEAVACPCCGQNAQVYARPISSMMAKALRLVALAPFGLTTREIVIATKQGGGGDSPKLVHWGLMEQRVNRRFYATERGRLFLAGKIRLPKRVLLYKNIVLGFDNSETVGIEDLTGERFDLEATMAPGAVQEARI